MRIFIIMALLVTAGVASATTSRPIMNIFDSDLVLTVGKNGSIEKKPILALSDNTIVLERSDCIAFNGDTNAYESKACLVKRKFGNLSITSEVAVD